MKFYCHYAKQIAKEKRKQRINLENQLKMLEKCLDKDDNISKYNAIKYGLDAINDQITEGIRIRSKSNCYNHTEKPTKLFLNLENQQGAQNTIKKLIFDEKEIIE